MQEKRLSVLKEKIKDEGEYTYVKARGCIVIDYTFVNEKVLDKVIKCKIKEKMDLDHLPRIIIEIVAEETRGREKEESTKKQKKTRKKRSNKMD